MEKVSYMTIKRRPLIACLSLVFLALIAMGAHWIVASLNDGSTASAGEERTDQAGKGNLTKVVLTGYVDVEDRIISLYPLQPGRVKKVLVQENQVVKAGDELLILDDTVAKLKVEQAKEDLKAATARFKKAKQLPDLHKSKLAQQKEAVEAMTERLAGAKLKLNKAKELLDMKLISQDDYDTAQKQVKELEAGDRA